MRITSLSQLKHGMKVRCKIGDTVIEDARVSINKEGYVYLCQNIKQGWDADDKLGYQFSYTADSGFVIWIETLDDDMLYMKEGDVVEDEDGDGRKVLAVLSTNALLSRIDDHDMACSWYTFKEMERDGYKLITPESLTIAGKTYDKAQLLERIKELPSL